MRKRIILPAILLTGALAAGTIGITRVSAQNSGGAYAPIVQKLAERFGLREDDVLDVFQEVRDERRANRFAEISERLDDFVLEGKITEEQKQKILDKHEEMEMIMGDLKNLSMNERKEKMQKIHEEMKVWSQENGIDFPFMVFKRGLHRSLGMGFVDKKLD